MKWLLRLLAVALAAVMIMMGAQKFGADNFIFATIAEKSGIPFFEPAFRMFSGVLEVIAGLLMLYVGTRGAGAALSTGIVAGAVVFHLSPWLGTKMAMEPGGEPSYQLFTMALVFLVLALINLVIHRKTVPILGRMFS